MAIFAALFFVSWVAALVLAGSLALAEGVAVLRGRNRPWLVEASAAGGEELAWRVAGRRRAARAGREVAAALEHGRPAHPEGATRL
jgi:hypothetical protein